MLTINIESNKTPPFVESNQLVVFNVIDNNQESHQITSRVVQIQSTPQDKYNYNFSIRLSPVINEINRPSSVMFSNIREQQNFNYYIDNFKMDRIKKRYVENDVITSPDSQLIMNPNNNWDAISTDNYLLIKHLLTLQNKKSSIRNLYNEYNRKYCFKGLNDELHTIFSSEYFNPIFNDMLTGYCLPTIYNNRYNFWENNSVRKILDGSWQETIDNLNYHSKHCFITKMLYPVLTNSDVNNFYFGGYLEPFPIRNVIENKIIHEYLGQGVKSELVDSGKNARGFNNISKEYIDFKKPLNSEKNRFFENIDSFSITTGIKNIAFKKYKFQSVLKDINTNSIFDKNGLITTKQMTVIANADNQYPIYTNARDSHEFNALEHDNPIVPFRDTDIIDFCFQRAGDFYNNLNSTQKEKISVDLVKNINKSNIILIDSEIQYAPRGYDIDKSSNPIGRDSKIYLGLKE